jgi:hypothetical protein
MGTDLSTYRARVGCFDSRSKTKKVKSVKVFTNCKMPCYITLFYLTITNIILQGQPSNLEISTKLTHLKLTRICKTGMCKLILLLLTTTLLLLAGDVHPNPGPNPLHDKTNLACYFLNARSIKKITHNDHKLREFQELLTLTNPDIMGVSETWLTNNITNNKIDPSDKYMIHRKDRSEQKGGGVMCLINKTIKSERMDIKVRN